MSDFTEFKLAVEAKINELALINNVLFHTGVVKDRMWETYLSSFPEGTNPIYRTNREFDCNCCKSFIRNYGNVVTIVDGKLISIWDVKLTSTSPFVHVAGNLAREVKSHAIVGIFKTKERNMGVNFNVKLEEDGTTETYAHLYAPTPSCSIHTGDIGKYKNDITTSKMVFLRALKEISEEAVDTVLELIRANELYRGQEHEGVVNTFDALQQMYKACRNEAQQDNFAWLFSIKTSGAVAHIKNSSIGTLLMDLSGGMDEDQAVRRFDTMMAPQNYQRPNAVVTKASLEKAKAVIEALGYTNSLNRRFATKDDVGVNNLIFVDRAKETFDVFATLKNELTINPRQLNAQDCTINAFIEAVIPTANSMRLLVEKKHKPNLFSLLTAQDEFTPTMFKWDNSFSWAYAGGVTDSIKERVKKAGGRVDAYLRCSLAWFNTDDLDLSIVEPKGDTIYYGNPRSRFTKGELDVDMNVNHGSAKTDAVENIYYPEARDMIEGEYVVRVTNFSKRNESHIGFDIQFALGDFEVTCHYPKTMRHKDCVTALTFKYTKEAGVVLTGVNPAMDRQEGGQKSEQVWGVPTYQFTKVNMMMLSPNHWDGANVGNKHMFFILDGCTNPDTPRGFFNEYLSPALSEHRKVFETIGGKLTVEKSEDQLSGLGFSSTQEAHVYVEVTTDTDTRVYHIQF